jgi:hypothetical protein
MVISGLDSTGSGYVLLVGFCVYDIDSLVSMEGREFSTS